ncbi:MAG: UDP-N-acetylmuramoyl-L-alanyl-D-glutamate--2,6-diaminopimelate ligase [Chlamydiota bacterium]
MKLKHLLKGLQGCEVKGSREIEITGIASDSRTVAPGNLFLAKKGLVQEGGQFIQQALEAGAVAIVTDIYDPFIKETQVICLEASAVEAALAAKFWRHPSKELFVVGITGTKGKTTTSYLAQHLLDQLGKTPGLISTVETIVRENRVSSTMTTHDAITNQKLLRDMVGKGCKSVCLEVSSHGLAQDRVGGIDFDVGIFTNLFPDHLDYHQTIENYASVKRTLFEKTTERAILNADSSWGAYMAENCKVPLLTFGIDAAADLQASQIQMSPTGLQFEATYQGKSAKFYSRLIGDFNVSNLLGVIALGVHLGIALEEISTHLSSFQSVPGRLESVPNDRGFSLFVDYAHVGEALDNVLKTLRKIASKRVIVVFGCGGNRDPARRIGMAKAAEKWADLAIVTNDNPRREDQNSIFQTILSGFENPGRAILEPDRKKAIELAVGMARREDIVLIAGKGHEKNQIFAHQTVPFDDVAVALEALQTVSIANCGQFCDSDPFIT